MTIKIVNNYKQHDQDSLSQHHHESSSGFVAMDEEENSFNSLMKEEEGVVVTTDTTSSDDMNPLPIDSTDALCSPLTMACDYKDLLLTAWCMAAKDECKDDAFPAAVVDNSEPQGTNNKKAQFSPCKRSSQDRVIEIEAARNDAKKKRKLSIITEMSENDHENEDTSNMIKKLKTEVLTLKQELYNLKSTVMSNDRDTPPKVTILPPPNRNMARRVSEDCYSADEVVRCSKCTQRCAAKSAKSIMNKGRWTEEEHALFLQGLEFYGRGKWALIASLVKTRTHLQIRTHAQKHFQKLASMAEGELEPACWDLVNFQNHNQTTSVYL